MKDRLDDETITKIKSIISTCLIEHQLFRFSENKATKFDCLLLPSECAEYTELKEFMFLVGHLLK